VYAAKFVFQDMLVPMACLSDCLACFRQELGGLFPLWICPYVQVVLPPPLLAMTLTTMCMWLCLWWCVAVCVAVCV
jgi:hypothetical protein